MTETKGAEDSAEAISSYFTKRTTWKALMIGRTEIISGSVPGSLDGYRQAGMVARKEKLTAGDERIGPKRQLNQGVGAGQFDLAFPTGHRAPPVHPNCRCVLRAVREN